MFKQTPQATAGGFVNLAIAGILGCAFFLPKRHRPAVQLVVFLSLASFFGVVGAVNEPEAWVLFIMTAFYAKRYKMLRWVGPVLAASWIACMIISSRQYLYIPPSSARSVFSAVNYNLFWITAIGMVLVGGGAEMVLKESRYDNLTKKRFVEPDEPAQQRPAAADMNQIRNLARVHESSMLVAGSVLKEIADLSESGIRKLDQIADLALTEPNPDPDQDQAQAL